MSRPKTVLSPKTKISVRAALKKHGLVNGIKRLKEEKGIAIGLQKANEVAAEFGLTFSRGRPTKKKPRVVTVVKKARKTRTPKATPKMTRDEESIRKAEIKATLPEGSFSTIPVTASVQTPAHSDFPPLTVEQKQGVDDRFSGPPLTPDQQKGLDELEQALEQSLGGQNSDDLDDGDESYDDSGDDSVPAKNAA